MSIDMSPEGLARLDELAKAATPGPWAVSSEFNDRDCADVIDSVVTDEAHPWFLATTHSGAYGSEFNSRFIAAAREAVPALITEVRRLGDENKHVAALQAKNTILYSAMEKAASLLDPDLAAENARLRNALAEALESCEFVESQRAELNDARAGVSMLRAEVERLREALEHAHGTLDAIAEMTWDIPEREAFKAVQACAEASQYAADARDEIDAALNPKEADNGS